MGAESKALAACPENRRQSFTLSRTVGSFQLSCIQRPATDPPKPGGILAINYFYFQSVIGWASSLLAIAGFSGLVKSA